MLTGLIISVVVLAFTVGAVYAKRVLKDNQAMAFGFLGILAAFLTSAMNNPSYQFTGFEFTPSVLLLGLYAAVTAYGIVRTARNLVKAEKPLKSLSVSYWLALVAATIVVVLMARGVVLIIFRGKFAFFLDLANICALILVGVMVLQVAYTYVWKAVKKK